uniref:protein CHUP1, chloroplastic-like n=1 Tax=Erigeron canadensis TaxID=72917 RepID=UPI001CB952AD|nr:protein CHUP1, chloroplastic-like [Erigeron canadensis]
MGSEKKDINQVVLKVGLALVFSLGGMFFSFIRNKRIKPSQSPKSSDCSDHESLLKDSKIEVHVSHKAPNSLQFDPLATDKHGELHTSALNLSQSPHSKPNADIDSYLLPEFNDLVKEFDMTALKTNLDLSILNSEPSQKENLCITKENKEQEIKNLRNMVKMLKEKERNLEAQLIKSYGLKEQESAVRELQNRLKLNNMEAKLLALKVESLKTDNKRLEAQMVDYDKVVVDLEAARAKIKVLQRQLRVEAAQNKERLLDIQQRVQKMQEDEHNGGVGIDVEMRLNICKLKDLEAEAEDLRKSNYSLQLEKAELAQRLEQVQNVGTSLLEDEKTEKLKEEHQLLKKQNEDLTNDIEQLQADRCSDVEELVYLRWINACLRYELRNQQPGPGKTMARDLSKTLSPKSEEKAKQLILEYANKEDGLGNLYIPELDSDHWSNSQSSNLTDSEELDDSFIDYPSSRKSNSKFFRKFVKFLRGKDGHNPDQNHQDHDPRQHQRSNSRNSSFEQSESAGEFRKSFTEYIQNSSKRSMDFKQLMHRYSDVGTHKRIDSIGGGSLDPHSSLDGQKSDLVKYAVALQDSGPNLTAKYRRRSTSIG